MQVLAEPARPGEQAAQRMLLLPPAYAAPEDFVQAGFGAAVRERGLALDLLFAPLELAHLTDRSIIASLHQQVLQPARERGCTLWVGGISLGGFIALLCAAHYAPQLAGLCLFAPYLGSHIVTGEIARAHGADAWEPGAPGDDDDERRVWRFIKTRPAQLPVHLGMARGDRFADRHAVLAAVLPPQDVDEIEGAS